MNITITLPEHVYDALKVVYADLEGYLQELALIEYRFLFATEEEEDTQDVR
jgi:hypothetical protein